jgi:hypothetical protein
MRLSIVDVNGATLSTSSFRVDPSPNTGIYESVHTFSMTVTEWVTLPTYPVPIDNVQHRYVLQGQVEEGTGTTIINGFQIIGVQVFYTVVNLDDGAS